jgi:hypothetical protein
MRKPFVLLAALAFVVVGVFTHSSAATGQSDASSTVVSQPPRASTTLVVRGTIQKYDPPSKILALSTSNGTLQFAIPSTARIRQGWHRIDASALENLSGFHVAVRYSESGAEKTVQSVHVFGRNQSERQ